MTRLLTLLWFVSFLILGGCGSTTTGAGGQCLDKDDCPGGECVDGKCQYLGGNQDSVDAAVGTDSLGPLQDTVPGVDTDQPIEGMDTVPGQDTSVVPDQQTNPNVPKPSIFVDPENFAFSFVPGVANPQTTTVLIYNQGVGTLQIDKLYWKNGSSGEFTFLALPPLPKKVYSYDSVPVTVIFQESAPHGNAWLVIESNDPDRPVIEVEFSAKAKVADQPCIQIAPSTLNFGQVVRGQSKTLPFTIVNCSTSTVLQITKVERSSFFGSQLTDEFQFNPDIHAPMMLGANQSAPWEMVYTPGLAGLDSGYFTFTSNDPQQPQAKLNVSGVGVPPPLEEIGLHVELEWDTDSCDVDLHVIAPGGEFFDCDTDCHFGNPNPDWGTQGDVMDDPFLDYDDVDGYGPENTNISEPQPGTYKILLHYYRDNYEGSGGGDTNATVRVFSYGQLLQEFGPTNLDQTNRNWDVCLVDWPSAHVTPLGSTYMADTSSISGCLPFFQ